MAIIGYSQKKPGSYVERTKTLTAIPTEGSTIGAFIGETPRGATNKAIKITSWKNFLKYFARGFEEDPFTNNFALEVFDFFANGGAECYIVRPLAKTMLKAKFEKDLAEETKLIITASDEGTWGNKLVVSVTKDTSVEEMHTVKVKLNTKEVETIKGKTLVELTANVNSTSEFIQVTGELTVAEYTLIEGSEGTIDKTTFDECLKAFNIIPRLAYIGAPHYELEQQKSVHTYCNATRIIPIVENLKSTEDLDEVITRKGEFTGFNGVSYYPHVLVPNPIAKETIVTISPICGIVGVMSSIASKRGIHKAPAGEEAVLVNAIGVAHELDEIDCGKLNGNNVNCIVNKPGKGVVIWGARIHEVDGDRKFVSDLRLDNFIEQSIDEGTEFATFESVDQDTMSDCKTVCEEFLRGLFDKKSLKGASEDEAFSVVCDESNNNEQDQDYINIDVAYAKKKPAEFIISRITKKQNA